jgi:hypothetical protein
LTLIKVQPTNAIAATSDSASVGTFVASLGVSIIAELTITRLQMTITATSHGATIGAIVGLNFVAIVTLLFANLYKTVTADRNRTTAHTGIGVVGVTVVTGFIPLSALGNILALNPVAAGCCLTTRGAGVGVDKVTIVAFLAVARLNIAVAAARRKAGCRAAIGANIVAVVAFFDTHLHIPILTARRNTVGDTAVGIVLVPIVAKLVARGAGGQIDSPITIAACGVLTRDRAGVKVVQVGVIASLAASGLDKAITAARYPAACRAIVRIDVVAIVAFFAELDDGIAAASA